MGVHEHLGTPIAAAVAEPGPVRDELRQSGTAVAGGAV
jgi:hypothetical protein